MRYYVYALIDPQNGNQPFYIGKGLDNRLQSHFAHPLATSYGTEDLAIVGCDTHSIVTHAQELSNNSTPLDRKLKRMDELRSQGFDHTHIARIVARRLNESTAFAVEACLIKSVYGIENLTNLVEGEHSERFRPYNNWNYIEGFDQSLYDRDFSLGEVEEKFGKYYVYVLRDPKSEQIFYVGKGTHNRQAAHFFQAMNSIDSTRDVLKVRKIRALLDSGFQLHDISRIVARVTEETHAFALEALFVKFVFGLNHLTNIQPGHHSGLFRAKDDWEKRKGFDLPFVVDPGARVDRSEKLDLMLGEALDAPLMAIQEAFPSLRFDPPKILDSADLSIEADVGNNRGEAGARLKVFIRRRRIQTEVRWRKQSQRQWIIRHFSKLMAYPLRRVDDVFFPDQWRGASNMTDDVREAIRRVRLLLDLVSAESRAQLSPEAAALLQGLPKA